MIANLLLLIGPDCKEVVLRLDGNVLSLPNPDGINWQNIRILNGFDCQTDKITLRSLKANLILFKILSKNKMVIFWAHRGSSVKVTKPVLGSTL